eukprot:TRINITY_DN1685_c0_g1_i1.p1 TRINITY_DN1685_c0_g1~~TRINITY_DN1685_c0_g1_i1.p1  ORF type:complete len:191 (-),score=45.93 TRINITY_DN1685_c0_g1_i1:273-845(-)
MAPANWKDLDAVKQHLPDGMKNLRACLKCRLILTKEQYFQTGCPNCPDLQMTESESRVSACTTMHFQGMMSLVLPGAFASRFTGLQDSHPGCYALTVKGDLPTHILEEASNYEGSNYGGRTDNEGEDDPFISKSPLDDGEISPTEEQPKSPASVKRPAEEAAPSAEKKARVEEETKQAPLLEPEGDTEFG